MDLSIKSLKVIYETREMEPINPYFDAEVRKLAKKFGIKWYAQGVEAKTGIRDLAFGETIKKRKSY